MPGSLTVLHVVESFGGGVATALFQYCAATPEFRHHLLRTERIGNFVDSGETEPFESVSDLDISPPAAIVTIRRSIRLLRPDVIHAHSSIAGLYVRLGVRASPTRPIVYTPHGYAMERRDVSSATRAAFGLVEKLLARNTSAYAACSFREQEISSRIGGSAKVFYVPNVAPPVSVESVPARRNRRGHHFLVVATGRLTAARDPHYFAAVARSVKAAAPDITFKWIGGGEPGFVEELAALGVEVTGWLPRSEALNLLSEADVMIHPAAWDGFPMVLLEANKLRIPSYVRDIPAFATVPRGLVARSPDHLAAMIITAASDPEQVEKALEEWDAFLQFNTTTEQARRLGAAYYASMEPR
ncbi:glycosyltransferase [Arthrobacter sp. Ld5]|uniref:glycosyltransferase n=1 Tax=Arthrobacter sp. Ld5 TaxID=649152 RepID=UPI003EB6CD70